MLRAGTKGPNPLVIAGLDESNIMRLKNGFPINVPLADFSPGLDGRLLIFYGKTPTDLEETLKRTGCVTDKTKQSSDQRVDQEESARRDNPKILIATVGLPRSGKTTWAKSQAWPIVNPDSVRLAIHGQRFIASAEPFVWATAKAMVSSLFLAGHQTVILDATNTTKKRREEWISNEWATFFKVIPTSKEECLARAEKEGDMKILPVIERMSNQYESLVESERQW